MKYISVSPAVVATQPYIHIILLLLRGWSRRNVKLTTSFELALWLKMHVATLPHLRTPEQRTGIWSFDSLRARRSGVRMPMVMEFFAPLQTGPGAHPASVKWVPGLCPRGKADGAWPWHSTFKLAPRLKKEYSYTSTPTLELHALF
jgi:hypothetical protein